MNDQLKNKLQAVTKSCKHVVRKVTEAEANDLIEKHNLCMDLYDDRHGDWFTYNKSQVVLSRRADGQHVLFTI